MLAIFLHKFFLYSSKVRFYFNFNFGRRYFMVDSVSLGNADALVQQANAAASEAQQIKAQNQAQQQAQTQETTAPATQNQAQPVATDTNAEPTAAAPQGTLATSAGSLGAGAGLLAGYYGWKAPANCKYLMGLEDDKFEKATEKLGEESKAYLKELLTEIKNAKEAKPEEVIKASMLTQEGDKIDVSNIEKIKEQQYSEKTSKLAKNVLELIKKAEGGKVDANEFAEALKKYKVGIAEDNLSSNIKAFGKDAPKMKSLKHGGIAAAIGAVALGIIGHFIKTGSSE